MTKKMNGGKVEFRGVRNGPGAMTRNFVKSMDYMEMDTRPDDRFANRAPPNPLSRPSILIDPKMSLEHPMAEEMGIKTMRTVTDLQ